MDARIETEIEKHFPGYYQGPTRVIVGKAIQEVGRILAEISKDTGCQCASCVRTKTAMSGAILTAVGIKP